MANNIFFKTGLASSLPSTKTAGQLLFAIDGTAGSIYLDKDSNTRIKFNADAIRLANPHKLEIDSMAGTQTVNYDGSSSYNLVIPQEIGNFDSIESHKFIISINDSHTAKVTLQYNTTNECLEFIFT